MPTLDSDHNHYTLGRRRQSSQSSGYGPSTQLVDDPLNPVPASSQIDQSLPTLPAYTYTLPTTKRPVVSTTFKEHASNHNINGYTHHLPREDDSPDPHDFYRRYQDPFAAGAPPSLGQADIVVTKPEDSMVAPRHQRRSSPISARANGAKVQPLSTRGQPTQVARRPSAPSAPSVDNSPLTNAKSNPALSGAAKNRQTLKDLVHRFNQTPDEVPPLPRKSTSRATSFNSNQTPGLNHAKGRTLSQSKSSGLVGTSKGSFSGQEQSGKSARLHQRRGRNSEDVSISPILTSGAIGIRSNRTDSNPYASQSMTDLNPDPTRSVRKPLFGEVSAFSVDQGDLGYGIPGSRRRRGSEGSMHSPNPMFPIERQSRRVSPSSPSAWYLGVTPTLEEIKLEKTIPSLPPSMHRRTRSDFAGALHRPLSPNISTRPSSTNPYPTQPLPPSPTSARTSKRDSQSRIPVSSRRLSLNSDSSNSTPSTRNNSAMGRNSGFVLPPKKGTTALPKPSQKSRSPARNTRQQSSRNSPRRSDFNPSQRPATSPRLAAYISAPMPKKSPPLRSSRPRQPVSSASTSASRARAVDRLSGHESAGTKASREPRSKRPPELGVVDFAARRQKIHEAFTKTVRENERQEIEAEKRRISMAIQSLPQAEEKTVEAEPLQTPEKEAQKTEDSPRENRGEIELVFETPAEESSKFDDKFDEEPHINTSHLAERSVLDLEDSPTLGDFNQFSSSCVNDGMATPPSDDAEPSSAVTASTSDTIETFFDNEPQEEPQNSYHEHRSLLSHGHIMDRGDSSPTSITEVQPSAAEDDCTSEKDDRESIQIMLSDTPVLERTKFNESFENKSQESTSNEEPNSRWSMTSWASSTRSKDGKCLDPDRDTPMERIDENSPSILADSAHLSISTATSDQTPQAWSPATASSPRTVRTTMESEPYSIINRVLDYYHDPNLVSPELMDDFQQHVITQSPELARLGGWDPKKVTQIYLQKLAQDRCTQTNRPAARDSGVSRQSVSSLDDRPEALPEAGSSSFEEQDRNLPEFAGESVSPPQDSLTVDDNDYNPHRASLSAPADWADMSPSMNYWMTRQAEAADSPLEEKPNLRKGWKSDQKGDDGEELPQELPSHEFRPQLPPIKSAGQGLGIKLVVMSPQDDDSPTIPPPLPDHTPPPPPEEPPDLKTPPQAQMPSPPSPGFYGQHNPSRAHPKPFQIDEANNPVLSSADTPQRSLTSTPSAQPPSLQNSQARQSTGGNSVLSDASAQPPGPPTPDQKRLTKRRHIIKELVDTEHSFGQDMKVVDDIYRGTSNVIIISAEDVKTLFGNSGEIVAFSTNFLDALKQSAKAVYVLPKSKRWRSNRTSNATSYSGNTDDQSSVSGTELNDDERDRKTFIGEAFANHMSQMEKVYSEYLKNHDAANQKLQALQKNQKVQIWLKECRAYAHDLTTAWDLDSLLVKPVQRILKYPLLLDQLLEVTSENHPDYTALDVAAREMKGISMRINEMKRRADLMDQVANRKRNQSDVRGAGVIKKFGRRTTEKLIQQVGLSDTVEDKVYASVAEKFGSHFFQLQVVMRDVEMYTKDVGDSMERFNSIASAMEEHIDVSQTSYPELESKWRKFKMSMREIQNMALPDHIQAVRKNVIDPMTTCLKLHDGPQKMMQKRSKRLLEYNRYKALKDRGEKPDKKTVEHGEQFMAVNETLKEELPKLFALTKKLVEACLINFVQLQLQWHAIWRRKLSQAIDESKDSTTLANIIDAFVGDFRFFEGQLLSLGICNGSVLADAINPVGYLSPTTPLTGDGTASPRQTTSLDLTKSRTLSVNNDVSPMLPQPDFGTRGNANFFGVDNGLQLGSGSYSTVNSTESNRRMRASSAVSSQSPHTPEIPGAYRSYSNSNTPISNPVRPTTAITRTTTDPIPSMPRQSLDTSNVYRPGDDATIVGRRSSGSTTTLTQITQQQASSPSGRFSGFFSSAMPMSDSPPTESPVDTCDVQKEFHIIFLAASIYPFNIDRARREAGYPYLTYVAGEIFDIIGEKGELWLAKNQDDSTNQIGWIWNKHFIKLGT